MILIESEKQGAKFACCQSSIVFANHLLFLPIAYCFTDFQGMKFFGWLLRNSGAFYIRRSFGDDQLYWAVFTEYVQTHLCNGDSPVEFFVEGTRSRTQKSLSPKFGKFLLIYSILTLILQIFLSRKCCQLESLLHILKCTQANFIMEPNSMNPDQTAP